MDLPTAACQNDRGGTDWHRLGTGASSELGSVQAAATASAKAVASPSAPALPLGEKSSVTVAVASVNVTAYAACLVAAQLNTQREPTPFPLQRLHSSEYSLRARARLRLQCCRRLDAGCGTDRGTAQETDRHDAALVQPELS